MGEAPVGVEPSRVYFISTLLSGEDRVTSIEVL